MTVELPALAHVEPGRPITATAWNEILDSLGLLRDAINAVGSGELQVTVHVAGQVNQPVAQAEVVAVDKDTGKVIRAALPFPGRTAHTICGIGDGTWDLHVSAPNHQTRTEEITFPDQAGVSVGLTPDGKPVPDLFGLKLSQAKTTLSGQGMTISKILDSAGKNHAVDDAPGNMRVLYQLPPQGTVIKPAVDRIRLVIAAEVEITGMVQVPDVTGMTPSQAAAKLAEYGLGMEQRTRKAAI
ncbi:MAG: PASTA domain-containing protein [Desulfobulbus sp.]